MTRLVARGLSKLYGQTRVVDRIDFELRAGEIRALVGENGAGKSTLIRMISGATLPSEGTVELDGRPVHLGAPHDVRRQGISVVYQELSLVPHLTVAENIFLGRELGAPFLRRAEMMRATRAILADLDIDIDPSSSVVDLNIGHRQMIEIARAILSQSKVLILDEPSATLSSAEVDSLLRVVRRIAAGGTAVIYVSHRLDEVLTLAETVTVLRDGRHVATEPVAQCDRARLVRLMVGRDVSEEFPSRSHVPGEPILSVQNLSSPQRFRDVGFTVRQGEIVGVAGLVGSGRTSVGLALVGAIRSTGTISLLGRDARFASPATALQRGVAYVTEDRKRCGIFGLLGTDENIAMSQLQALSSHGWLLTALWQRSAAAVAQQFDLRTDLRQLAGTLSGGNQQKALVGRYVIKPPAVLVVDEPTRGVDVGARVEIYRSLNELARSGIGILMISSDLEEVLGMSDRIVVMREGRVAGELTRAAATSESVMALATQAA